MPDPITVRAVREGDEINVAVEGGYVRRKAPCDGVAIETPDRDLFLPVGVLLDALGQLDALPPATPSVQLPLAPKKPR